MCEDVMNIEVEVNVECPPCCLSGSLTEATCGVHQVSLQSASPGIPPCPPECWGYRQPSCLPNFYLRI